MFKYTPALPRHVATINEPSVPRMTQEQRRREMQVLPSEPYRKAKNKKKSTSTATDV